MAEEVGHCTACGEITKCCGGDADGKQIEEGKQIAKLEVHGRKRQISEKLDKELEEEIESIKRKIETVKEKGGEVVPKKSKPGKENRPQVPEWYQNKQPRDLHSGFWMQEAKTSAPPLSFLSSNSNTFQQKSSPKFAPKDLEEQIKILQDQCYGQKKKEEVKKTTVDRLFKQARSNSSKKSKLKLENVPQKRE